MNWSIAALVLLALVLANLPFLTERFLGVVPFRSGTKHLWWRLLEIIVFYAITGVVAWLMERKTGQVHDQGWVFWVVTICLFLVFSYPGFVYRYLWRRRG
ncbi:MAG TPA: DUF2818 family protein [Burkholderiales bacterium]|nr:DUF2818 family protein [Burkholderiales bacterium]